MKKLLFFAGAAGLLLVSASPPSTAVSAGASAATAGYPPCSATVRDRCIQIHERGVATRSNLARNDESSAIMSDTDAPARPEPRAAASADGGNYPPCSATLTDRCTQVRGRGGSPAYARNHRAARTRDMQLAYRAGERG